MSESIFVNSSYAQNGKVSNELMAFYKREMAKVREMFDSDWMSCVERYCCVKMNKPDRRKVALIKDKLNEIYREIEEIITSAYIGIVIYDWKEARNSGTVAIGMYEIDNLVTKALLLDILTSIGYENSPLVLQSCNIFFLFFYFADHL